MRFLKRLLFGEKIKVAQPASPAPRKTPHDDAFWQVIYGELSPSELKVTTRLNLWSIPDVPGVSIDHRAFSPEEKRVAIINEFFQYPPTKERLAALIADFAKVWEDGDTAAIVDFMRMNQPPAALATETSTPVHQSPKNPRLN